MQDLAQNVGSGAIIVGPAIIGEYVVIGAGAVVTRDMPPRTFVADVPARVVRQFGGPRGEGADPPSWTT